MSVVCRSTRWPTCWPTRRWDRILYLYPIVEPANTVENPQSIYIGHIGQVHYVSSCSALCSQNSNEIDKDRFSTSVLNDPMEDDNTQSLQTESDRNVANSCNGNLSTSQNKITETCELSNSRKRQQKRAANMRQYRMTNISPEKKAKRNENQRNYRTTNASPEKKKAKRNGNQRNYRTANESPEKKQSAMKIREIIGQQMHLQRKKQSAMRIREIIGQQMHLQRKKQSAMRIREIIGQKCISREKSKTQ